MPPAVTPFRIQTSDEQLRDLQDRLRRTRWPDPETVDDWSQGVPLGYLRSLCEHWSERYDWRDTERRLNAIPQFTTAVEGLDIHFLHLRSPVPGALPLILTHGWPGSVVEFLKVLGPLTDPASHGGDPADAFDVVCPSLPGYGFSSKPTEVGWGVDRIGSAWTQLMARLGYERYGAQGGDWGAMVTASIGQQDVEHLAGIHLNMPVAVPAFPATDELTESERAARSDFARHRKWGSGYSNVQSTRPQTVGYGLLDSPAAQCAWIVEKFGAWTDSSGDPEAAITRDELLDNVMVYWLTGTGASSARLYWESFRTANTDPVQAPTGCSIFPREILRISRRMAETRFVDLRYWNELDRGGHFAAFEQPELFVRELRSFFRLVR